MTIERLKLLFDQYQVVTVGYKGFTKIDAGYFYCPYIPLMFSGVK